MKWFLNLPQWARLSIALPLTALAFAAILLGYKYKVQPNEVVWHERARHWDHMPLTVLIEDFQRPARVAINLWNSRIGCTVFVIAGNTDVTIKSHDGTPCSSLTVELGSQDAAGGAYLCGAGAEVHVMHPGDIWQQTFIIHHELGHILGLADEHWAAMGPIPEHDVATPMIRATDKDTAALKERYCK